MHVGVNGENTNSTDDHITMKKFINSFLLVIALVSLTSGMENIIFNVIKFGLN